MSRTRRRSSLDIAPKRPDVAFMGDIIVRSAPTEEEIRVAHQDGKHPNRPGRRAKEYLSKGRKPKMRRALGAVVEDPDNAPMPREVRDHVWNWN